MTRNEDHFVRNHGGIPTIDPDEYFFEIGGLVNNPRRITLKELQDESIFPRQSNVVSLQCSGTRRIEQINQYPGDGDELINAPVCALASPDGRLLTTTSGAKEPSARHAGPVFPSRKSSNTAAVSKTPMEPTMSSSSAQTLTSRKVKSPIMLSRFRGARSRSMKSFWPGR